MNSYLELESKRAEFIYLLRSRIGCPYIWGGNGPYEFDCSGLMVWGLRKVGLLDRDLSASSLASRYKDRTVHVLSKPGELCFYGSGSRVTHVTAVLTCWYDHKAILIGANGGRRSTTTEAIAYEHNAYVGTIRGDYRANDLVRMVDPFKTL